ncbi:glycosyltransferase family 2 protein [Alkalilimnicola sp. S0819]|uniref:glycosyltransferase family 2 protein n=1 Tax=Alkalilimnicola sp. S0819 TaxID=2613922 RepID=UPI00186A77F8|nr:glycosyltransferase family 2 protein [Alkalilimnicola sp. S0819]
MYRISVIIPVYNYAERLPRTLQSVLPQLAPGDEIVLVDDGSTDESLALIQEYAAAHPDRIVAAHQANAGPGAARNHGFRLASGTHILFLDADDQLCDQALPALHRSLRDQGDCPIVIGGYISVHEGGRERRRPAPQLAARPVDNMRAYIRKQFGTPHGAVLLARRVLDYCLYPEHLRVNEDLCFFTRILARFPARRLDEALAAIHHHGGSLRHDLDAQRNATPHSEAWVFEGADMPREAAGLRREFGARRLLSLSRACLLSGRHAEGRTLYAQAVKRWPRALLQGSYLRKYLRSFTQ